ncbi:hypothetical protein HA075_11835 [bacterium BFN5]|nr:hypothetical protein HA075_11760 [bacterium BFN5]QJW46456.1 hypothetical protein HA075_11835 [bacterium BFN5]
MSKIYLYIKAIRQYYQTDKARHDLLDYLKAGLMMVSVMILIRLVLAWVQ